MSLISSRTALAFLIGGLMVILIMGIFLSQPLLMSLVFLAGLIMALTFLHNVKWGIFLILLIRPSIDKFSEQVTINLGRNLHFNAAAIFGILVVFLLFIFLFKHRKKMSEMPLKKPWFLFLLVVIISVFISIEKISSIYEIIKLLSVFLVFSSIYIIVKKEKKISVALYAIIFSSLVPFLFATYQLITRSGLGGSEGVESRLFGTFSHSNSFASFVVIVFSLSLYLIFQEKNQWLKWLLGAFIAWEMLILEQTYARGAWLALLIFLFIVMLKKSPKILLAIILMSTALFFFSETIHDRVEDIYNPPADSSVRWRFAQWGKMYGAYLKKPLTGYGFGTETVVHEREFGFNAGNQYTHNDPLRLALETGIFGFLIYCVYIYSIFIRLAISYMKEKNPLFKDFNLFTLALFIAILSYSLTNNTLHETVTQWTLWAIIGTSLALSSLSQNKFKDSSR